MSLPQELHCGVSTGLSYLTKKNMDAVAGEFDQSTALQSLVSSDPVVSFVGVLTQETPVGGGDRVRRRMDGRADAREGGRDQGRAALAL